MREVSWRLNRLQHIEPPPVPLSLAALLSHSAGLLNRGSWGPSPLLGLVLTASNCNKLTPTNSTLRGTGLYNCLTPTCFLWASHLHWIQPVHTQSYILMSSAGCTCSLIDGWVEGQYDTVLSHNRVYISANIVYIRWGEVPVMTKMQNCGFRVSEFELKSCLGSPRGVMVKAMDCGIVVSEFVLQSHYYVHFRANTLGKDMNPLILPAMGQIVPLLFF